MLSNKLLGVRRESDEERSRKDFSELNSKCSTRFHHLQELRGTFYCGTGPIKTEQPSRGDYILETIKLIKLPKFALALR